MKRIILTGVVLAVCVFQSLAQTATNPIQISVCRNHLPYIYTRQCDGLQIQFEENLQYVDTSCTGDLFYVNFTVDENPPRHRYERLCQNATKNIDGYIFNGADYPLGETILQYHVNLSSESGCDILRILHLTVVPTYNDTIEDKTCLGTGYFQNGFVVPEENTTTAGTFYYTNIRQSHYPYLCDSIVTLKLTVNPQKIVTIYAGICEGETYSENGFNVSTQGTYTRYGTSAEGCDSTTILILDVYHAGENRIIDAEICEGNVYQANGFYVNGTAGTTTTYVEDRVTNDGCPYTVTLNLTVLLNLKMDTPFVGEICGDAGYFPITYNVLAGRIDSIFVAFDEKAHNAGFENFIEHNPTPNSIKIPLPTDIRPDNYSVTLYFDGRCYDTTFTFDFTVLYPSSVMQQRWNDVIILKNSAYNGGYDFYDNKWLVNGLPIDERFDKGTYIYTENTTLRFGSEYRVLLTREGEYQSFCSCPLIPVQHFDVYEFPRIVSAMGKIKVYSNEPIAELSLINLFGQTVGNGRYAGTEIEINADAGIHIIRLITDKGQIYTQKIIVQQ